MAQSTALMITDDVQKVKAANVDTYSTLPWMTKYEFDQLIGLRTMHLSRGAVPLVTIPPDFSIESNMRLRQIAIEELQQKKLPYLIKRTLPNGKIEYWPVSRLMLQAVQHMMR